jgi:hypothetical protein
VPRVIWPNDHDFYPDDDAMGRHDPGKHYGLQFEQLISVIQRREKWLLGVFAEKVDIWLKILPSDPNFRPCSCRNNHRGQSPGSCYICYGTGAIGGYQRLTLDNLATIRLDLARNHISPIDDDGKRLISNREVEAWDRDRALSGWDVDAGRWLMRFPMAPRYKELVERGKIEKEDVSNCWFFCPLKLDESDFFVRANGRRYKFIEVFDSTWRGLITHTQFTAQIVDEEDIIYSVGVKGSSVSTFESDPNLEIQEELAQEIPILTMDTSLGEEFLETFKFEELFSYKKRNYTRFRK